MGSRYLYLSKWGSGSRRRRRCYRPAVAAAAAAAAAASAAAARSVTKMMMDRQARTLPGPCLSPCQDHGAAPRRCTGLGALRTGLRDLVLWRARQPVLPSALCVGLDCGASAYGATSVRPGRPDWAAAPVSPAKRILGMSGHLLARAAPHPPNS